MIFGNWISTMIQQKPDTTFVFDTFNRNLQKVKHLQQQAMLVMILYLSATYHFGLVRFMLNAVYEVIYEVYNTHICKHKDTSNPHTVLRLHVCPLHVAPTSMSLVCSCTNRATMTHLWLQMECTYILIMLEMNFGSTPSSCCMVKGCSALHHTHENSCDDRGGQYVSQVWAYQFID